MPAPETAIQANMAQLSRKVWTRKRLKAMRSSTPKGRALRASSPHSFARTRSLLEE
jgi:hypothetical protein